MERKRILTVLIAVLLVLVFIAGAAMPVPEGERRPAETAFVTVAPV